MCEEAALMLDALYERRMAEIRTRDQMQRHMNNYRKEDNK